MIKASLVTALFLTTPLFAQNYPANEFFAGYSASGQISAPQPATFADLTTAFRTHDNGKFGYDLTYTHNFNEHFGLRADFSSYIGDQVGSLSTSIPPGTSLLTGSQSYTQHSHSYNTMFGPEWRFANRTRFTPFVYGMAGVARVNSVFDTSPASIGPGIGSSAGVLAHYHAFRTGAEMAVGGGVDFRAASRVSMRFAMDYNPTFLGNAFAGSESVQSNVRMHLGFVFHSAYDRK